MPGTDMVEVYRVAQALLGCEGLPAGAAVVLDAVGELARNTMANLPDPVEWGQAMLYVRRGRAEGPEAGLFVRGGAPERARPSMSTWQKIRETQHALVIDVLAGGLTRRLDGQPTRVSGPGSERWSGTPVTHVLAWPLRAPGMGLCGMVLIELNSALDGPELQPSLSRLDEVVQPLLDVVSASLLLLPSQASNARPDPDLPVVGEEMAETLDTLRQFAPMEATLLLRGETGTGKTSLARWCHARSHRANGPFRAVRLNELPSGLDAGALFGHRRGAFTGAQQDQEGLIASAESGTLFLDEIDKLSRDAQSRLLGLLDDGSYTRLGDTRERRSNVRFVVGTNADLEAEVRQGRFLPDLLHRVNVLPVRLLPLRERRGEIAGWARHFLSEKERELGVRFSLAAEAEDRLRAASWSGNLRELQSVMVRVAALSGTGPVRVVGAREVERALKLGTNNPGMLRSIESAAEAFLDEAERARAAGRSLGLKDADSFRGFVLRRAVARYGAKEAWRLLGTERSVEQGNFQRLIREQVGRAEVLEREVEK